MTPQKAGVAGIRIIERSFMRSAFTLIEIAIASVVLIVGLSAALSMLLIGLDWGREINLKTNVINTARAVVDDPKLIDSSADSTIHNSIEGYVNGLFVVRTADPYQQHIWTGESRSGWQDTTFDVNDLPGFYANVTVEVWEGVVAGDKSTGNKVFTMKGKYYEAQP